MKSLFGWLIILCSYLLLSMCRSCPLDPEIYFISTNLNSYFSFFYRVVPRTPNWETKAFPSVTAITTTKTTSGARNSLRSICHHRTSSSDPTVSVTLWSLLPLPPHLSRPMLGPSIDLPARAFSDPPNPALNPLDSHSRFHHS